MGRRVTLLYCDIENADDRLLCMSYAVDDDPVLVSFSITQRLAELLADPDVIKVTHTDHDLHWFKMHGWEVGGPWHDTKVMAWLLDENQDLDLASLTARYLDPSRVKTRRIQPRAGVLYFDRVHALSDFAQWPDYVMRDFIEYSRFDTYTLRHLYRKLLEGLDETDQLEHWESEEVPYSTLLLNMECRGIPIDLDATAKLADEVRDERDDSADALRITAGLPDAFNLDSPQQLAKFLFTKYFNLADALPMATDPLPSDHEFTVTSVGRDYIHGVWHLKGLGLEPTAPARNAKTAEPSTSSPDLLFKHPNIPWVRELCLVYRRADKLLNTYLDKFPKVAVEVGEGYSGHVRAGTAAPVGNPTSTRIFGRYNQTGTVTGRLSSSDPNLQNIPARRERGKQVRALFKGNFVVGDYDALELRIMAHLSGDPTLLKVFRDGEDPHALTADALSVDRDAGKLANYAISYGAGPKTLAQSLTLAGFSTTMSEAKGYLTALEATYRRLFQYINHVRYEARETGGVTTIGGRRRHLRAAFAAETWKEQQYGARQAVSTIVSGSAADVFRRAMLALDWCLPSWLQIIAQVHDELVLEEVPHDGLGVGVANGVVRGGGLYWDVSLLEGSDDYFEVDDDGPRRIGESSDDSRRGDGAGSTPQRRGVEEGVDLATVFLQERSSVGRSDVSTALYSPEAASGRRTVGFRPEGREDPRLLRVIQSVMETAHGFTLKVPLRFEPKVCATWADK